MTTTRQRLPRVLPPSTCEQLSLLSLASLFAGSDDTEAKRTITERFLAFHEANPEVYRLLLRFAREAHERGRTRLGIRMLWERMRWYVHVETHDPSGERKLNDHFPSRYARLLMANEPDLAELFEVRELRAA